MKIYTLLLLIVGSIGVNAMNENIGLVDGKFKQLSNKPNWVSSQAHNDNNRVKPIEAMIPGSSIARILEEMGGEPKKMEEAYFYFTFTSSIFGFTDDVEVLLDRNNEIIHFKSSSRVGYSDLGANLRRYKLFKQKVLSGAN